MNLANSLNVQWSSPQRSFTLASFFSVAGKKYIRSSVREHMGCHIWVWAGFIMRLSADCQPESGCQARSAELQCQGWSSNLKHWRELSLSLGKWSRARDKAVALKLKVDQAHQSGGLLFVWASVKKLNLLGLGSVQKTWFEREQWLNRTSHFRSCAPSRQITLPVGDGRQIKSHPYAECKNCCHPLFAASWWLLVEQRGWSIWWKRLIKYWKKPAWSEGSGSRLLPGYLPSRVRCCEAAEPQGDARARSWRFFWMQKESNLWKTAPWHPLWGL